MPQGRLSDKQLRYLDWLCTPVDFRPDDEKTQLAWTNKEGVSSSLPGQWKRENQTFRRAMKERFHQINTDPHLIQGVIEAIQAQAAQGDMKAAALYLQITGTFFPTEKRIVETNQVQTLSNEELLAEMESEADRLRAELSLSADA